MRLQAVGDLPLSWASASAVPRMLFQPIVDLAGGGVVGFEALARGPEGSPWERPTELFAQARAEGRLRELDWACRVAALRDARAYSPARPPWRLFVNTEAEVLGSTCPEELLEDWTGAAEELDVVVEVTERALVHGPRRLVQAVGELRALGCEIALDDVGANPTSLALLPLLEPDVVKLDGALLRRPHRHAARAALRAVERYVERTGALLVAEGIETEADLAEARSLGARWGQGFLFDRPRPLDASRLRRAGGCPPRQRVPAPSPAPSVESDAPELVVSPVWVTDHLRAVAHWAAPEASMNLVLLHLPDPSLAPPGLFADLERLHEVSPLSATVLGRPRPLSHGPAPRSGRRDTVAVLLGPSEAHVMVATPRPDGRFDVVVSDRTEVAAAAARAFVLQNL